jgi:hypothetical protein
LPDKDERKDDLDESLKRYFQQCKDEQQLTDQEIQAAGRSYRKDGKPPAASKN